MKNVILDALLMNSDASPRNITWAGNLCLNYYSASKMFPSIAILGQHQHRRSDNRQQMSGSRSAILHARPSFRKIANMP
jgi:hypothetical protein